MSKEETNTTKPGLGKPCILYVDDDESNVAVIEMRLESHYETLTAMSDREACVILRSHANRLALVLLDIQLVGSQLDGVDLARLIRGKLPANKQSLFTRDVPVCKDLPILFVSAYGEQHDVNTLFEAGGSAIVAKPIDFVKLSRAMTRYHLKAVLG